MALPTISEYADTVSNPYGLFRTLGEFEPERDMYGNVRIRSGNNAAVFRIRYADKSLMLKCYFKKSLHSESIYRYLADKRDDILSPVRLLRNEMYVYQSMGKGGYQDVVISEWVEGNTLETEIRRAGREFGKKRFTELAEGFDRLALEIIEREWAHGDLKPENIICCPDGNMRLIDYDAMFIPTLAGCCTNEVGTPAYQHPSRSNTFYDKHIDDYSIALLSCSLHALAEDDTLFCKYNRSDNLILYPAEIISGTSRCYDRILEIFARRGMQRLYNLALALNSDQTRIPELRSLMTPAVLYSPHPAVSPVASDLRRHYSPGLTPQLFTHNGKWGFTDSAGNVLVEAVYDAAYEFSESVAVVCLHGVWQVIDTKGDLLIDGYGIEKIKPFSEGLAPFRQNGLWGYIDLHGNKKIPAIYELAGNMHEGRAPVRQGGLYGYIDHEGRTVIPFCFDHATGFRSGRATVFLHQKEHTIDYFGQPK